MPYSPEEKAAGRHFREEQQRELDRRAREDPAVHVVPNVLAVYRHSCPKRRNISTSLPLREMHLPSPAYHVFASWDGAWLPLLADETLPNWAEYVGHNVRAVPAGRFAFVYREGICGLCGQTARSNEGRLIPGDRPPIHRRATKD